MKILLVEILLAGIVLTGCADARIYTFKRERVDQSLEGNRGYLEGASSQPVAEREVPKRTLIGIDMVVPLLPGEKGYVPKSTGDVIYEEDIKMEPKPRVVTGETGTPREAQSTNFEPKKKVPARAVVVEEEAVEEEETWVK